MSPFTDTELAQIDRAAEQQAHREAFDAAHPEFRNALIRAELKARDRRFTGEPLTGFGPFDQE